MAAEQARFLKEDVTHEQTDSLAIQPEANLARESVDAEALAGSDFLSELFEVFSTSGPHQALGLSG